MPLLTALALWSTLRRTLALLAAFLLTLLLLAAIVIGILTSVIAGLSPARGGGGQAPPSGLATRQIPPEYLALLQRASAATCGLPWQLLAAIARRESNFTPTAVGPDLPQFAGTDDANARGMMQFLPSTYALFSARVDALTGKGLGAAGIWDPESATLAAALYLCESGAAEGDYRRAIFAYNRADWYVDEILALAAAYGMGGAPGGPPADVVAVARQYLGWPYVWGGASPETSFDCSGLTQWSYRQVGVALPRTAQQQFDATQRLDPGELQPGDLVFFAQTYPDPANWITHVGIYVGGGRMINAPQEGDVIQEASVFDGYWGGKFAGAGRVRR